MAFQKTSKNPQNASAHTNLCSFGKISKCAVCGYAVKNYECGKSRNTEYHTHQCHRAAHL